MRRVLLPILALILAAGSLSAAPAARDLTCIFQQTNYSQLSAATSQEDHSYPFEAWLADDFICDPCLPLTHLEWGGGHWGYGTFGHPTGFLVWIWEDGGAGMPGDPYTDVDVYCELVTDYAFERIQNDYFWYSADVPNFTPMPGVLYWISVQALLDFDPNGLWGMMIYGDEWGSSALQFYPLLGMSTWTDQGYGGAVFALYSQTVDTADDSWSGVKALW